MLADILDAEEIQTLSEACRAKFESFVAHTARTAQELREENAQLKARCESSSFQLEVALSEYRAQTSTLEDASRRAKQQAAQFGADLDACRVELGASKLAAAAAKADLEATKRKLEQVEREKMELFQAMEKRIEDLAVLNEHVESLQLELSGSQQQLWERAGQIEELKLELVSAEHAERRLRQAAEHAQFQLSMLREEAGSYRQEVAQLRCEKAGLVVNLQADLDAREEQLRSLNSRLEQCQASAQEQKQRAEALSLCLREAEEGRATLEARFSQELQAQVKLTNMHEELSESRRVQVEKLVGSLEKMRDLLIEAQQDAEASRGSLEEAQAAHARELAERETALDELRKELQLANSRLQQATGGGDDAVTGISEDASLPSPSVVMAAHVSGLAGDSGMSLTDLLTERLEQQQALQKALLERDFLQRQLSELSGELAEKMPIVVRNMQEYERAMSSIDSLREQLTGALVEQEQRTHERDNARCALDHTRRSLQRCQQEAQDLSRQVCRLLQEVEEARGGAVVSSQDQAVSSTEDGASTPPLTAAEVISMRLVTFGSIEELQQRNVELLTLVRELSERQEAEEKATADERSRELHERLGELLEQLQEIEQERTRQAAMVASLANQRDTYRALLAAKGYKDLPSASTEDEDKFDPGLGRNSKRSPDKSTGIQAEPGGVQDNSAALNELQQEFDTYKKEMAENYRMVSEQLSEAQEESRRLRLEAARREAELTHVQDRLSTAQGSLGPLQKEASMLRERLGRMVDTVVQHQQVLTTLRQELSKSQDAESRAQVLLQSVQAERDQLRETNARLERDVESERQEKSAQARILANLQTLQLNLERMDGERRGNEQDKLSHFKLRCESLARQLESQSEQQKILITSLELQLEEAWERASLEAERARKSADELVGAYVQLYEAQKQLSEKQSLLEHSEGSEVETAEVSVLKVLLTNSEDKVKELEMELSGAKERVESLQTACSRWEARVAEQDDLNIQSRGTLNEVLQAKQELEEKLSQLEQANHELATEKAQLLEESKTKVEELERELSASQAALTEAKNQMDDRARRDAEHLVDQDAQSSLAKQAQEKYERELLLHAADVEALTATRAELEQVKHETSRLERQAQSAEETLAAARESWCEQERQLHVEKDNLAKRVDELSQHNTLLYLQFETLSSQVALLKEREELASPTGFETPVRDEVGGGAEEQKRAEQLREVVHFLRREKELVAARAEAAEAECARLAVQLEHRSASLQQAQQELGAERDRALAHATSDARHAELVRKVEMVELLTESNKTLRSERSELASAKRELEERCDQLERELAPLREEVQSRTAQAEALQADVRFLREEVQRWRQRTNQLLEQSSCTDAEGFHKLSEENAALKQEALKLKEELEAVGKQLALNQEAMAEREHRLAVAAAESSNARSELTERVSTLEGELREAGAEARAEAERLRAEAKASAAELQSLQQEKEEKLRTIIQLKKIARHYRSQFEETKRSKEALDRRCTELEQAQSRAAPEGPEARSDPDAHVRQLQEEKDALARQLEQARAESDQLTAEKEQATSAAKQARDLVLQSQQRIADISAENEALTTEKRVLEQRVEDCQQRIATLEQMNDEGALREDSLHLQYEGKLLRLKEEMQGAWEAFEHSQRQVEELTRKLSQQQKHSKPTMVTAPVERLGSHRSSAAGEPGTANVLPLTPPPQCAVSPLQRQGPSGSRLTPTARIGPTRLGTVAPMGWPPVAAATPITPALGTTSEQDQESEFQLFASASAEVVAVTQTLWASGLWSQPVASGSSSHGSMQLGGIGSHKREIDCEPFSSGLDRFKRRKPAWASGAETSAQVATSPMAEPVEEGESSLVDRSNVDEEQQSDDDAIVVDGDSDDDLQGEEPKVECPEGTDSSGTEEEGNDNEEAITTFLEEADGADEEEEDMGEMETQDETDDDGEVDVVGFVQGEDEEQQEQDGEEEDGEDEELEEEEEEQVLPVPSPTDDGEEVPTDGASTETVEEASPSLLVARRRNERLPLSQSADVFEDGDDAVVPRSPMLCVPQKMDDFPEAIDSPPAPHGDFVFGTEGQAELETSDLLQLASQEGVVDAVEEPPEKEEEEEEEEEAPSEGERLSLLEEQEEEEEEAPSEGERLSLLEEQEEEEEEAPSEGEPPLEEQEEEAPSEGERLSLLEEQEEEEETPLEGEPPLEEQEEEAPSEGERLSLLEEQEEDEEVVRAASESSSSSAALVPEAQDYDNQRSRSSSPSPEPIMEEPSGDEEEEPGEFPDPAPVTAAGQSPVPTPIPGGVVTDVGEGEPEEEEEEASSSSSEPDDSDVGPAATTRIPSEIQRVAEKRTPSGASSQPASSQQSTPPKRRRIVWEDPEPSSSFSSVAVGGAQQALSSVHVPSSSVSMRTRSASASQQLQGGLPLRSGRRLRLFEALPRGQGAGSPRRILRSLHRGAGSVGQRVGPAGQGAGPPRRGAGPEGQRVTPLRRVVGLHRRGVEPLHRGVGLRSRGAELRSRGAELRGQGAGPSGRGRGAPMWSRGRRAGGRPPRGSHSF